MPSSAWTLGRSAPFAVFAFGIVPVYTLPGISAPLLLNRTALADIFVGRITQWNDPVLRALNPSQTLPAASITVVARSDASQLTTIFTAALAAFSPSVSSIVAELSHLGGSQAASLFGASGMSLFNFTLTGMQRRAGSDGVLAAVNSIPFSIGFATLTGLCTSAIAARIIEFGHCRRDLAWSGCAEHRQFCRYRCECDRRGN